MAKVWDPFAGKMVEKGSPEWKRQRASELGVLRELDPEGTLKWMDRERMGYPTARGQLHREARRQGRMEGDTTPTGGRGAKDTTPDWLKQPWRNLYPSSPGEYTRWGQRGERKYRHWDEWYAPEGQVEDQPHLAIINRLLPYMNAVDAETLSRQLYISSEGRKGPFKEYLRSTNRLRPMYGPPKREPRAWDRWYDTVDLRGNVDKGIKRWWNKRPKGDTTDEEWRKWWEKKPEGEWREWFDRR